MILGGLAQKPFTIVHERPNGVRIQVGGHAPFDFGQDAGAMAGDAVAFVESASQPGAPVQKANGVVAAEGKPVERVRIAAVARRVDRAQSAML